MIKIKTGDIIDDSCEVFCHQVNCKGKMTSGLNLKVKTKYPNVYRAYRDKLAFEPSPIGDILMVATPDDRICVNMFSQLGAGNNRTLFDYKAFQKCLEKLTTKLKNLDSKFTVAFPYAMGNNGGDWNTIQEMLNEFSEKVEQKIIILRSDEK